MTRKSARVPRRAALSRFYESVRETKQIQNSTRSDHCTSHDLSIKNTLRTVDYMEML